MKLQLSTALAADIAGAIEAARNRAYRDWTARNLAAVAALLVAYIGGFFPGEVTGAVAGTIGYFSILSGGSPNEVHIQGDVTATGGGGAMTVDNTSIGVGQVVTVNSFTLTAGNA